MDRIFIRNREVATKEYVDETVKNNVPQNVVLSEGVTNIVQLTQAQYDALEEKDSQTLYLILG
jgi:hypothetical protein